MGTPHSPKVNRRGRRLPRNVRLTLGRVLFLRSCVRCGVREDDNYIGTGSSPAISNSLIPVILESGVSSYEGFGPSLRATLEGKSDR